MSKHLTNEQLVGSYLDNEMSQVERSGFESELLHNSELREEFNLQKDLINGIKESRRLELKSRLNNIPIQTPIFQTIAFKSAVVASVSAIVGFGAYYLLDKDDPQLSEVEMELPQAIVIEEEELPTIPEAITPVVEDDKSKEKSEKKPKKEKTLAKNTAKEEGQEPEVTEPNVIAPEVVEGFNEEDFNTEEIVSESSVNNLEKIKENLESTVEITAVKDRKNKFHYKFYENKLYLLGDFTDMPYEIIELNRKDGKSYFLFYENSFFKLHSGQLKPAPLIRIENDSLVSELKIIQMNQQ